MLGARLIAAVSPEHNMCIRKMLLYVIECFFSFRSLIGIAQPHSKHICLFELRTVRGAQPQQVRVLHRWYQSDNLYRCYRICALQQCLERLWLSEGGQLDDEATRLRCSQCLRYCLTYRHASLRTHLTCAIDRLHVKMT